MTDMRYPIGKFHAEPDPTTAQIAEWLAAIESAPVGLRAAIEGLTPSQLDTPYRDGGWTVRQVIHHVADSHMQSYSRFRFALTELAPAIKPYDEAAWAELPDARSGPVSVSLSLLDALHARWTMLLRSLDREALGRTFVHPQMGPVTLTEAIQLYAWHGRHHTAHITTLRRLRSW